MNTDIDTDIDIEVYLSSKGLRAKRSGTQVYTQCVFCNEDPGKRGRLYVDDSSDDTRGLYYCHLCGTKGNLRTLRRHFGDDVDEAPTYGEQRVKIFTAAAEFYETQLRNDDVRYLTEKRGLLPDTIEHFRLGYAPGGSELYEHLRKRGFQDNDIIESGLVKSTGGNPRDFLQGQITIPYYANGYCVQVRGKDPSGKYLTPSGNKVRLYNADAARDVEDVVVCEGEFDAMVMTQLGYAAVAVPGANAWQDNWDAYLEDAKTIWAVYDPDDPGRDGATKLRDRLGRRVRVVELPVPDGYASKQVDPTFLAVNESWTREQFDALLARSRRKAVRIFSFRECVEDWHEMQRRGTFKTGFANLDSLIYPGMHAGQLFIPAAMTNAGKTMWSLNLLQRASMVPSQKDIKIMVHSLELTRGEFVEAMMPIWWFFNKDCEPEKVLEECSNYWDPRVYVQDANQRTQEDIEADLDDFEDVMGGTPDLMLVDYLGYFARSFKGTSYESASDAVMALKAIAKDRRTVLISPTQLNRSAEQGKRADINQARDSGVIENTADLMVTMWSDDAAKEARVNERTGKNMMHIGKNRGRGKGEELEFFFSYLTHVYVQRSEEVYMQRMREELVWSRATEVTWRDAMEGHRIGIPPQRVLASDAGGGTTHRLQSSLEHKQRRLKL